MLINHKEVKHEEEMSMRLIQAKKLACLRLLSFLPSRVFVEYVPTITVGVNKGQHLGRLWPRGTQ